MKRRTSLLSSFSTIALAGFLGGTDAKADMSPHDPMVHIVPCFPDLRGDIDKVMTKYALQYDHYPQAANVSDGSEFERLYLRALENHVDLYTAEGKRKRPAGFDKNAPRVYMNLLAGKDLPNPENLVRKVDADLLRQGYNFSVYVVRMPFEKSTAAFGFMGRDYVGEKKIEFTGCMTGAASIGTNSAFYIPTLKLASNPPAPPSRNDMPPALPAMLQVPLPEVKPPEAQ